MPKTKKADDGHSMGPDGEIEIPFPHIPDSELGEAIAEFHRRIYLAIGCRRPWLGMFHGEPEPERKLDAKGDAK